MEVNELQGIEIAKKIINTMDLQPVIDRLIRVEKWPVAEAIAVVQQYRNYLFLRKKYPQFTLPPSKDIDEAWHAHILHTKAYREFCRQVFTHSEEQFLDHNPAEDEQSAAQFSQYFEKTQELYKREFGEYIYQIHGKSIFRKLIEKLGEKLIAKFPNLAVHLEPG